MRLLRVPAGALLSLFLAFGAAAGVVRVPAAGTSAPLSAPAAYAGYQAGLTALDPAAAKAFLADGAARDWLKISTPDMYASSLLRAHEIVHYQALPARHKESFLRREIIAVEALPLQQEDTDLPAKHRAAYGLEADAKLIARASCAWDELDPVVRAGLEKQDVGGKGWAAAPVSMRAAMIVAWWHETLIKDSKLRPGTPAYLAQARLYARKAGPYMTDQEATEMSERLSALERIAKRLPELRAAVESDPVRARELDAVVALSADDAVEAKAKLEKKFGLSPSNAPSRFVYDGRDRVQQRELAALAKRLTVEFRRLAAGTSAEKLLEKAEGRIQIGGVPAGSDGAYQGYGDKLALPADVIDHLLVAADKRFEEFTTDPALLRALAVLYLPTYVHESTHRLQSRVALKKSLTAVEKGMLYGHEDEQEAYLAQELFVREFTRQRPGLAAYARSIPRVADIWDPVITARQGKRVSRLYSDYPGGSGRRALGLLMAITESSKALKLKTRIENELSWRRLPLGAGRRHDPVRLSDLGSTAVSDAADRLLRRWRDIASTSSARFADLLLEYFDEGDARAAALKASLRVARRTKKLLDNGAARKDGDERGFDRVPGAAQAAAGLGGVPKAELLKVLSARGGNSRLYLGEILVDGRPVKAAVKVAADVPSDVWAARIAAFKKERDAAARMTELLPRGWAPRFYGAVDAGGNPSLAFEIIRGKDIDSLTLEETKLLTPEKLDEAMAGFEILRKANLIGIDSPQLMMLTEDQTLNGVLRRRGDLVFMDAANAADEGDVSTTPQDRVLELLVVKRIGERFADAEPSAPVRSLQAKIPVMELGSYLRGIRAEAGLLPTPDITRYR